MKIEVLFVPGCRNYEPALERLRKVLASQSVQDAIATVPVSTEAAAKVLGFPGSPTIRINGEDIRPKQLFAPPFQQRRASDAANGIKSRRPWRRSPLAIGTK